MGRSLVSSRTGISSWGDLCLRSGDQRSGGSPRLDRSAAPGLRGHRAPRATARYLLHQGESAGARLTRLQLRIRGIAESPGARSGHRDVPPFSADCRRTGICGDAIQLSGIDQHSSHSTLEEAWIRGGGYPAKGIQEQKSRPRRRVGHVQAAAGRRSTLDGAERTHDSRVGSGG